MFPVELEANKLAKEIIPNSSVSAALFKHVYERFNGKISNPIDTSNVYDLQELSTIKTHKQEWGGRKYDVAFIVSDLKRKIKGPEIAGKIFQHLKMENLSKLVVGSGDKTFFRNVKNCVFLETQPHQDLMELLKNVKIVIAPSFFDASPNLLPETIMAGGVPLCTRNIGNSDHLVQEAIVSDLENTEEWVEKIQNLLENPVASSLKPGIVTVPLKYSLLQKLKDVFERC